jgi:hypothetical protein
MTVRLTKMPSAADILQQKYYCSLYGEDSFIDREGKIKLNMAFELSAGQSVLLLNVETGQRRLQVKMTEMSRAWPLCQFRDNCISALGSCHGVATVTHFCDELLQHSTNGRFGSPRFGQNVLQLLTI